jgi:hypothetical protein
MECEMEIKAAELVVGAVAVWRITHLLHAEDGPWDALVRLRKLAGNGAFGKMLDCFNCSSVWVALPMSLAFSDGWKERLLLWPALSGAAILLERATTRPQQTAPWTVWPEESDQLISKGEGR